MILAPVRLVLQVRKLQAAGKPYEHLLQAREGSRRAMPRHPLAKLPCGHVATRVSCEDVVPHRRVSGPPPSLSHSSRARPLIRANSHRNGARPRHHRRNCRRSFGTLAQNRATPVPPYTEKNDGDDAEDMDDDEFLACWYSECDCW